MTATAQLPKILIRNSYNIFGLSSSSSLKEIRKRSQQLLQLAKIEEIQEFDIDIGHIKEFRNESEIRQALERVSGIQDRLKEIFFWFEDNSGKSCKALEFLCKGSYQQALDIFEELGKTGSDWLDKKNLALALIFYAFASSSLDSFCRSLDLWKLIAESDDFWKFYEKYYLLHDELGTSPSLFEEFRNSLFEKVSEKSVYFYHQTKNPEVIGIFYSVFGRIGDAVDSEILQPVILRVKNEMDELEKISVGNLDLSSVKQILKKVHKYFSDLDKFELSEYTPLIILKNDTAEKLRSVAVDIYNEYADIETARLLLHQGSKLAVSEDVLDKIKSDTKQLSANEAWELISKRFIPVQAFIEEEKFEEAKNAYLELDNDLAKEVSESSASNRIQLLVNYCSLMIKKGHEFFLRKKFNTKILAIDGFVNRNYYKSSINIFDHVFEIITARFSLINLSPVWSVPTENSPESELLDLQKEINRLANFLESCDISELFDNNDICLEIIKKIVSQQADSDSGTVIAHLGIASCCRVVNRRIYGITQRKMWGCIGWTVAILFFFFITIVTEKPASKPAYKSSNYHTQTSFSHLNSQEREVIDWLDILSKDTLKRLRAKGYSDRQIARAILKKMRAAGYSDVSDYLINVTQKTS